MPGISSAIERYFAPKLTAETVIRQAKAHGLTNEVAASVMTAQTGVISLPLFMKLFEAIQKYFYTPEMTHMQALLGCKVASAQIEQNHVSALQEDGRIMTIKLGEGRDSCTTLYFIEEKKTDGSGETELFVMDYTHKSKRCFEQFSKLEQVRDFYKEDLAEDKDGIYSENLSKKQILSSTLGVALHNYGSPQFDKYDLLHFKKFFGVTSDAIALEEMKNEALKLENDEYRLFKKGDVDFLLSMVAKSPTLNEWDRNSTDYLLLMVYQGLSDGMRSIYQHIFTKETLDKYASLADVFFSLCYQCSENNPPIAPSFTREFILNDGTKVTLKNYSWDDYRQKNRNASDLPRVELTIADKIQDVGVLTMDKHHVTTTLLKEKAKHHQNYASIRGT